MRIQHHLQERHLVESVRRRVISEDQMQAILGVARSMSPAEGAAPDLSWVGLVQGLAAFGVTAATVLCLTDHIARTDPVTVFAQFVVAMVVCAAIGFALRGRSSLRVPAAVLIAGAVAMSWGVAFSLASLALGVHAEPLGGESLQQLHRLRDQAFLVADGSVVVAALAVGWLARVPATAAPGAVACIALTMSAAELRVSDSLGYLSPSQTTTWLMGVAIALIVGASALDRARRGTRSDAGFWLHTAGLITLGFAAAMRIADGSIEVFGWLPLALVLGAIGLRFDRRIYLVAAGAAVLTFPLIALRHLGSSEDFVRFGAVGAGLVLVSIAAAWLRRYYTTVWLADPARQVERTVWC